MYLTSRRMRILVAHNAYLYRGGEDTVVEAEIALLQRHGHEVMLYRRDNADLDALPRWQAAVDSVWSKRTVMEVGRLLGGFRPHLIHAHNTFPLISPSLYGVAEELSIPVVQTLHNFRLLCPQAMLMRNGRYCDDCVGRWPWRAVLHRCYRGSLTQSAVSAGMVSGHRMLGTWRDRVSRYIVLNQMCREIFIRGGLPPDKLCIKPNFVEAAGVPGDHMRHGGLFIGRLAVEKGVLTLAQAIRQKPVTRITVCGSGPLQAIVEQSDGLDYIGFERGEALRARISSAEFLVMPSTGIESFGLAAIEAFACGTPVIASRHGGLREIVEHGHNGLLVTPGNADELADAIAYAVANPMQMRRMGLEAYQTYLARYTPERNYTALLDIYHQVLTPLPTSLTAETIDA
jgi:glycosyltransferase involved in cell wall biosynthesis